MGLGDAEYAKEELAAFNSLVKADQAHIEAANTQESWQHLTERKSVGKLLDYNFEGFSGARNLYDMVRWIDGITYHNPVKSSRFEELCRASEETDRGVFNTLGLNPTDRDLGALALYNAQDMIFSRYEHLPERLRPRVVLDFGAGHGRQANLWAGASDDLETFIAVDATPGPYLTQRLYYQALGLKLNDYLDMPDEKFSLIRGRKNVNHLPSWRMDLIPTNSVDLIILVQVLRELTPVFLIFALREFKRILRQGGSLYIRDHIGFHNVNGVEQDRILHSFGFIPEWQPDWRDQVDVHGVPRCWKNPDIGGFKNMTTT
jgi:SAM-dependent methyltransferase